MTAAHVFFRSIALLLSQGAFVTLSVTKAHGADDVTCATAYEGAQRYRLAGKLREARHELLVCSQDTCRRGLQSDCREWLQQVEKELPTVVFEVRDDHDRETFQARVHLDDTLILTRLDGAATTVDPGEHRLRFELPTGGQQEVTFLARQGEKNRKIMVSFAPTTATIKPPVEVPRTTSASPGNRRSSLTVWPFVFGGVGVLALGGFAYYGLTSNARYDHLKQTCAPLCSQDQLDSVRSKDIAANVLLGTGIVALGVGAWLFFREISHSTSTGSSIQPPRRFTFAF